MPDTYTNFITEKDFFGEGDILNADDMQIDLLAQRTRYLKETLEGVSEMCKEMEIMRDGSREEGLAEGELDGILFRDY